MIKNLLHEIYYELMKVLLLNIILESSIVLLSVHLILSLFGISLSVSIVIAIIYFIIRFFLESRKLSLNYVEERNPKIREMLRTAADNQDSDSIMARALFNDVMKIMRSVSSGTLIDISLLLKRVGVILLLSIILVSLAFFNVSFAKFHDPLMKPFTTASDYIKGVFSDEKSPEAVLLSDDMYGDAKMAKLSNEELNLKIDPTLNEMDFNKVNDPDKLGSDIKDYPGDAVAVASKSDTRSLDEVVDRKTAAEYSQEVKK